MKRSNNMKNLFFAAMTLILLAACGSKDPNQELNDLKSQRTQIDARIAELEKQLGVNPNEVKSKKIQTTDVVATNFQHYIEIQGTVDAENNVVVAPSIPGIVTKIFVSAGDAVTAGQLLAETDNSAYQAQIAAIRPQLEMAQDVYERQRRLWEQKIGSEIQLIQAQTQMEALKKQIAAVEAQIELTKVKSPISGVIDHIGAKVGQFATAQNPDPSFRVINLASLKMKTEIAESYANKVSKGNKVKIFFPDANQELEANISFIAKFISPLTRTFTAEIGLPSGSEFLRPNMIGVVKIIDYENPNALTVPINIVQNENNQQFVFVAVQENGQLLAKKKMVTVGNVYNGNAEITGGLSLGEKVITTGYADLQDGMAIEL
ncbi:MAG: efflux RND transporter periplasmic adaptor subunit [Bacteroidetes bacterium]|nr:efflux RND transporter periplasmic adaptor subunit [Bacteroidota bacterium]